MTDDLTNAEIALLCDLGERDPSHLTDAELSLVAGLIGKGYLERKEGSPTPKLTAKATAYLGERGAGLNEA